MAALRAAVFPLSAKNRRGGHFLPPPPSSARGGTRCSHMWHVLTWSQSLLHLLHRIIIACSSQHIINGAGALVVLHILVSESIVSVVFLETF